MTNLVPRSKLSLRPFRPRRKPNLPSQNLSPQRSLYQSMFLLWFPQASSSSHLHQSLLSHFHLNPSHLQCLLGRRQHLIVQLPNSRPQINLSCFLQALDLVLRRLVCSSEVSVWVVRTSMDPRTFTPL